MKKKIWPIFWCAHILLFIVSTALAIHFYPKAFPVVDVDIKMDRAEALKKAKSLALQMHWAPQSFQQAASFNLDSKTQNFIELTAGGSKAFSEIIHKHLFEPYTWVVRHFAEGDAHEAWISFTPQGGIYDFRLKIPATDPGASLPLAHALNIAKTTAEKTWGLYLAPFQLIENSQTTRSSGRIDHSFTFERKSEVIRGKDTDNSEEQGRFRLRLVVSGDQLTEISHFVKIPESFKLKYAAMRSYNELTKSFSVMTLILLYVLGGCCLGLFFLARKKWVIWKTPMLFAVIVALLMSAEHLNQFPLLWLNYDTALSSAAFILNGILGAVLVFFSEFLILTLSFMAAESLTRKAFPQHIQFWKIWKPENASTWTVLGQTVGGYLSVGFFFAFVVLIYLLGSHFFGWWTPSDTLYQPNGLASFFPWLTGIANSLHAGFWEESLFRAIPLAGAALLGQKFGKKHFWIGAAFLLQAVVFATAHADYPAQPYYARVVELMIPSFIFGGIYLTFGLLPGILLHFTFDVISFSLPLFMATTDHIWIDRWMTILLSLIPLWIVLGARLKTGRWLKLKPQSLNRSWTPQSTQKSTKKPSISKQVAKQGGSLGKRTFVTVSLLGSISFVLWGTLFHFKNNTLPLEVSRNQAITLAKKALSDSGVSLSSDWTALTSLSEEIGKEEKFVWRTETPAFFEFLTGKYLTPPAWIVRFVRFNGSLDQRAEEYQVTLIGKGDVFELRHELPESTAGENLTHREAQKIAKSSTTAEAQEKSSKLLKRPARTDWEFIFSDPSVHFQTPDAQARIHVDIAGNQVASVSPTIYIPEQWLRQERNRQNSLSILFTLSIALLIAITLGGLIWALIGWARKHFDIQSFKYGLYILVFLSTLNTLNGLPEKLASFSPEQPWGHQIFTLLGFGLIKIVFLSLCSALLLGWIFDQARLSVRLGCRWFSLTGFCFGILGTAVVSGIAHAFPPLVPTWGKVSPLNHYFPLLTCLSTLENFIFFTVFIFILYITYIEFIKKGRAQAGIAGLLLVSMGFVIQGAAAESFLPWACLGLWSGAFLLMSFRFVIKNHFSLIPSMTAGIWTLIELKQIRLDAHPGATAIGITSILIILCTASIWAFQIEKKSQGT